MTTIDKRIEDISLILRDLLKVIKVVSMYPEDNPLPQSLKRSFAEKLEAIVDDHGEMSVQILERSMIHAGEKVFRATSKEENLAGLFYESGITEITFKAGLGVLEIYKLLHVVRVYLNGPDKSQDLAAMIWEAGIAGFDLKTLEDVALSEYDDSFSIHEYSSRDPLAGNQSLFGTEGSGNYESIFTRDEDSGKWESGELDISGDVDSGGDRPSQGIPVGMPASIADIYRGASPKDSGRIQYNELQETSSNQAVAELANELGSIPEGKSTPLPNSTLILNDEFKLSEEEEEMIRVMVEKDAEFEPFTSTKELLKEMLLQEIEYPGFSESVTICEKVVGEFIRLGRLAEAADVMKHIRSLETRIRKKNPRWADRLKEACVAAGARGRLENLASSLNDNSGVTPAELKKYLGNFGWEAYAGISGLVGQLKHQSHRDVVLGFLSEHGKNNVDLVARGIFDKNLDVVRNAMSILARVGDDKALKYLSRLTSHEEPEIRMQLVMLLRDCTNAETLSILRKLVTDSNPQIRRAAVNAIAIRRGPEAFEAITGVINDERFPTLEEEDQRALLNAFSVLGGEKALAYLSELITTYNHFRNRTLAILRSAAFEALTVNRSEKAERVLLRLAKSWRPDIRRQAAAAIEQYRENKYGDS